MATYPIRPIPLILRSEKNGSLPLAVTSMEMVVDDTVVITWTAAELAADGSGFQRVSIVKGKRNLVLLAVSVINTPPTVTVTQE